MNKIPLRIFKTHKLNRGLIPVTPGKNIFNPADGTSKMVGEIMIIIEDNTVKTREPAIINHILNDPLTKFEFLKPIYETVNGIVQMDEKGMPIIKSWSEDVNEVFINKDHEDAVRKADKNGDYDYIQQEDLDGAIEKEKAESKKLELLELKRRNEAKKKQLAAAAKSK